MSHADVLAVVARLHVDLAFRRAMIADPAAALLTIDLSDEERALLLTLDARTVALIGRIADHHRWMRIRDQLPWVDFAKRPDLEEVVAHYAAATLPPLLNRDEAMAFCRSVEQGVFTSPASPPYLGDLARYERLRIAVAWGLEHGPRVETFDFPILDIVSDLDAAGWPSVDPSPSRLVFKKVPGIPAVLVRP